MREIAQKTELNMHAWAEKIKKIDPKLAQALSENRNVGFENLEKFDLPRYKTITLPVTEFLKNPHAAFEALGTKLFNVILLPQKERLKRESAAEIDESQATNFIKEKSAGKENDYIIKIIQYFDNVYGGGIIIDNDGNIKIDLKPGQNTELAYGTVVPKFTAQSRDFTKTLEYSFEDPKLRASVFNTLKQIPHDENQYMPGNYEFLLVKKTDKPDLEPIFWDCRTNPSFYEANKYKLREKSKSDEQLEIERRLKHE